MKSFLFFSFIMASFQDSVDWGALDLLESGGFVIERAAEKGAQRINGRQYVPFSVLASRRSGVRASVLFRATSISPARDQDQLRLDVVSSRLEDLNVRTPSAVPLGADSRWTLDNGLFVVLIATRFEEVQAHMQLQGSDSKGFYKPPAHDWTQDQQLMERFLRYSLARIAGRRLGNITTSSMAGASIPTATCERSNAKYGDLRSWCSAKGWTVSEDKTLGVLTVKRGTTFAVVPMGTAWVKWDGATWTKMSDVVMEKDGRVMAPKDVLDRLNGM